MKTNFTRFRYVLAVVLCCLVSVGVWGQTYSYTFTKSVFSKKVETQSLGDKNWTLNTDGGFWGYDATKGQQIGSSGSPAKNLVLSTTDIPGTITSIKITTSGASSVVGKLTVKVGESYFGNQISLTSNSTDYLFNGSSQGKIELNYTQTSSKALYIKKIEIAYIEQTTQIASPTFTPESGTEFSGNLDVTLACTTEGASIRYTTDGTTPSASSTLYTAPFSITSTTTVKAIAIKDGLDNSEVAEATYTKVKPTPTFIFSEANVNIKLGETFTAPTLTYNGSNNLSGLTISYMSSNSNVATADIATGEVQILNGGSTTITASVDATETYQATEATYKLTVIDPNIPTYVLAINYNNKWYAIDQTSDATTSKMEAIEIEVNGNLEVSSSTNNLLWTIEDEKYLKAENGNYLQYKGTSGTNINLDPNAYEWVFEKQTNNSYHIKSKTVSTRFLAYGTASNQLKFGAYLNTNTNEYILDIYTLSVAIPANPSFTTDANGTMALTGPWAAADLSSLDLTAPTITGIDMTGITIPADAPALAPANPNCLIHVVNNTPESWKNVVLEDIALDINLQDGNNFYNSKAFEVAEATYTRTFAKGWNTFSLPFDATVAVGDVVEEFDTKTETSIKFKTATSIKANQAYLINIPADNTQKVFTGTGIVPVTASTGDTFKSNFTKLTGADAQGKYILVLEDGKEVFAPASEKATIAAFRGYIDLSTAPNPAKKFTIEHDGGATNVENTTAENSLKIYSENGTLVIYSNKVQNVQIFALDGRMVKNIQLSEGNNTINGLAKGIYLINNQKAIVK